jgi:Flp pilus assembly protein CpaB
MTTDRLGPHLRERLSGMLCGLGWRRIAMLRRIVAALLTLLALVLVIAPRAGPAGVPVVVAAAELAAGVTVHTADLAVRRWPAELVPAGVLGDPSAAEGRVLVGSARVGEAITDVRLVGSGLVPAAGPDGAAVPVRLADAGVAALLVPGSRVDVVTIGERTDQPVVLAVDATVLAVLAEEKAVRGRLVMVAMPRTVASRVAAVSLSAQVAVTLR